MATSSAPLFRTLAQQRLARMRREQGVPDVPLAQWIPKYRPTYRSPLHLGPLLELLERAEREPVNAVVHAPPRHAKSETILAAIARFMQRRPDRKHAYITYQADLAKEKSRTVQDLAIAAGVELRTRAAAHWFTRQGGALFTAGVRGPFTGRGVSGLMVIDDPFKNRLEAESSTIRGQVSQWFKDVAYTRREPGCSVIIVMTRWHPDDLAGEYIKKGWEKVCLEALREDTLGVKHALWPEQYPVKELESIRDVVGEFTWTSLYQGAPRGRGGAVFSDVHFYDELPASGYRTGIGFDLSYTKKTYSDYSVAAALRAISPRQVGSDRAPDESFYVAEVLRRQMKAPEFKKEARRFVNRHGLRARRRWYCSGTEIGVADLLKEGDASGPGVDVGAEVTTSDKYQRAQRTAGAWNAGRILVPSPQLVAGNEARFAWVDPFVTEIMGFTGLDDDHDDQVDALVGAHDAVARGAAGQRFKALAKL